MGVNIKDVAFRAGVSPSTVSRVIADHPRISTETKDRVLAVMKELDYHPNAIARSLVKKSSETLGILIPNNIEEFFNPFFPEVLRGITLPFECKLFARGCTPEHPIGPCMVSSEGSCAAYYRYTDYGKES